MRCWFLLLFCLILFSAQSLMADAIVVDFESFSDLDSVTTQIPGLTFSNATVLTAGISLNEFELPPHSGSNVVFDDGGPLSIAFTDSIVAFGAYFTYLQPITLQAFDAANNLVGSISSTFSSNLALSGDAGSNPNELLSISFAGGFSHVSITGNPFGGSFVMDDLTYTARGGTTPAPVPEPSSLILLGTGISLMFFAFHRHQKSL